MKRLLALGVAALVIASCSVPERAASETVPAAVTTGVADTSLPATTSAPTSTSTTAAVAETTTLPATTTTVATEDLIKQAVQDYFEAYEACGVDPGACIPSNFTATQGTSRSNLTEFAAGLAAQGLYFSSDRRGQYLVAESVKLESPGEASATYCLYDAGIVMGPVGPDGQATVVNDGIASVRYEYRIFLEDALWKVGREHELEQLGEGNLCPPSD